MNIYLADLVYDTIKTNHTIPLNIGYLAAALDAKCGKEVNVKLFKYPKLLEKALFDNCPDLLCLSNYSWNARLALSFLDLAKRLNHKIITVLGGPNIRTSPNEIYRFLSRHPIVDYYIVHEGEAPFVNFVKEYLGGFEKPCPPGCATISGKDFLFTPSDFSKHKQIDHPSPYLTGWLDQFLSDLNMIPLLETNRGCPFGCVYCTWGIAALRKLRIRPLEKIFEEIEYIAERSAGQLNWIFCDANFGILPRDVKIAEKLREVMDRKGHPLNVTVWHSKNITKRGVEIVEKLGNNSKGYIAIQSADQKVLTASGRGKIRFNEIKNQINYFHGKNLDVMTDILIGLPCESSESHLRSLITAFDMGFDIIQPYNIRLLKGSELESDQFREKYKIETKFRPIFGGYGIYDNKFVFEIEESIRATKDMNEEELNCYKIYHWLIYFAWNVGIFKPMLRLGQKNGVNPAKIISKVVRTKNALLKELFEQMKAEAMNEWFHTPEEMIRFYEDRDSFSFLVNNFMKLNSYYIALVYQKPNIVKTLEKETGKILIREVEEKGVYNRAFLNDILELSDLLVCKNLLEKETRMILKYPGQVVSIALNMPELACRDSVSIEIYRPKEYVSFCHFHLNPEGKEDLSLQNLTRFLEIGGMTMLRNKVRAIEELR